MTRKRRSVLGQRRGSTPASLRPAAAEREVASRAWPRGATRRKSPRRSLRPFLRRAGIVATGLLLGGAVLAGGKGLFARQMTRSINVCVATDYVLRSDKPNWEYRVGQWFEEVNRIFAPAGVRWVTSPGGDAYPERTSGDLASRRKRMEEISSCSGDLVVGFTGQSERSEKASAVPFAHSVLVAVGERDSDAVTINTLARALATLFAAPARSEVLVAADTPGEGVLDSATLELIKRLRGYDFAKGVAALPGAWERRATEAIVDALAGRAASPAAEARRVLARAYSESGRHANAAALFQHALQIAPADGPTRLELSLELQSDGRPDDAMRELAQCARIAPEDARPHAAMAGILLNTRRVAPAIEELRIAIRLDPYHPDYRMLLDAALAAQSRRPDPAEPLASEVPRP